MSGNPFLMGSFTYLGPICSHWGQHKVSQQSWEPGSPLQVAHGFRVWFAPGWSMEEPRQENTHRCYCWELRLRRGIGAGLINPPLALGTHCWFKEPTAGPRNPLMIHIASGWCVEVLEVGCRLHKEKKRLKTLAGWRTETLRKWRLPPAPLGSLAPG